MPDDKNKRGKAAGGKTAGDTATPRARAKRASPAAPPAPAPAPTASGETYDVAGLASKHGLSLPDAMGLIKRNGDDRAVLDRAAEEFKKASRRYRS